MVSFLTFKLYNLKMSAQIYCWQEPYLLEKITYLLEKAN